jgi:hypothetical protein
MQNKAHDKIVGFLRFLTFYIDSFTRIAKIETFLDKFVLFPTFWLLHFLLIQDLGCGFTALIA